MGPQVLVEDGVPGAVPVVPEEGGAVLDPGVAGDEDAAFSGVDGLVGLEEKTAASPKVPTGRPL